MVCSLHSVTTGSRDRANVSLIIIIIIQSINLDHQYRKRRYRIEVRAVFRVKTILQLLL